MDSGNNIYVSSTNTNTLFLLQIQNYYDRSEACRRTQGALYSLNDTARAASLTMSGNTITRAKEGLNISLAESTTNSTEPGDYLPGDATQAFYLDRDPSDLEFDVCIPLAHLTGFFNVDLLAPSFLAAGLQVHIDFYKPSHFFVTSTENDGLPRVPTILNPAIPWQGDLKILQGEMHLETFTLTGQKFFPYTPSNKFLLFKKINRLQPYSRPPEAIVIGSWE